MKRVIQERKTGSRTQKKETDWKQYKKKEKKQEKR